MIILDTQKIRSRQSLPESDVEVNNDAPRPVSSSGTDILVDTLPTFASDPLNAPHFPGATSHIQLLCFLIKKTLPWVAGGIALMLFGIGVIQAILFPHFYVCPSGATCSRNINPTSDNLQILQSLMQYWLQFSTVIAEYGLFKLMSYQSWLCMKYQGSTIRALGHSIGAIRGNVFDAFKLLLKKQNRSLGILATGQIIIILAISVIVGYSISSVRETGSATVEFTYPESFVLPTADYLFNHNGWRIAMETVDHWLVSSDPFQRLGDSFRGTFVLRDNRTLYALSAQPAGSRIIGGISCVGVEAFAIATPSLSPIWSSDERDYNVTLFNVPGASSLTVSSSTQLAVNISSLLADLDNSVFWSTHLWVSNTTGLIPNATAIDDGNLNIALCNHTIAMVDIPCVLGNQLVEPSRPVVGTSNDLSPNFCGNLEPYSCSMLLTLRLVDAWWGLTWEPTPLKTVSCRAGVLSRYSPDGESCHLDNTTWTATLSIMLDALLQTSEKGINATQELRAVTQSISRTQWWWQGIVPLAIFLFYIISMGHTMYLNRHHEGWRKLTLAEVLATYTDVAHGRVAASNVSEITRVGGIGSQSINDTREARRDPLSVQASRASSSSSPLFIG